MSHTAPPLRRVVAVPVLLALAAIDVRPAPAQTPAAADCVAIGIPKPSVGYSYQHRGSGGAVSEYTNYWEEVTPTGSRLRTVRGTTVLTQVNQHRIVDDVSVVDVTTSNPEGGRGSSTTTFRPGVISDPAFRACAGRSWPIAVSTAVHSSGLSNASAPTYPGTLTIVAIREAVTVPAGRFDTVRYTRTLTTPTGRSVDEYWKSIEHGVVVRHTATYFGGSDTEILLAIR